ncbi:chlorite dismutase family protein [Salinibacterium sp. SYSU T00001]|uniref:hydrogen peroxide-dependent heme synthase n=1 Tax=Homoserinimonas sedimenticola TaxID=2986805 RepID=UPI002235D725|nr:hydrogen peroxide-dependent heme synthase [Salinibacterium sedimenticola]MCW4384439.1 chlorite dismutase family protein [Salinibacterium sedimenticola]
MTSTPPEAIVTPASGDTEYTLWAVLRRDPASSASTGDTAELAAAAARVEDSGVTVRGFYDVSSIRADSDVMVWLHGTSPERVQAALRDLRRTSILRPLLPTWNTMGVHRDAEFSAQHIPAFMRGKEPAEWLTVYPFVRSYEWYLLDPAERRAMLGNHGRMGAQFPRVLANTVASFALGDYEWILALEADDLLELVDLMRHLRATDARMHVREEVPFYTGRRVDVSELADVLA